MKALSWFIGLQLERLQDCDHRTNQRIPSRLYTSIAKSRKHIFFELILVSIKDLLGEVGEVWSWSHIWDVCDPLVDNLGGLISFTVNFVKVRIQDLKGIWHTHQGICVFLTHKMANSGADSLVEVSVSMLEIHVIDGLIDAIFLTRCSLD